PPHVCYREVVLPHVDAVGIRCNGNVYSVVHYHRYPERPQHLHERPRLFHEVACVVVLPAKLDRRHSTEDSGEYHVLHRPAPRIAGTDDEVQREVGGPQPHDTTDTDARPSSTSSSIV